MAGWSIIANGSGLDSSENVGTNENKDVFNIDCNDNDIEKDDESEDSDFRLRMLFDEVLSLFVKAINEKGVLRPLPVILYSRKRPVDLFKLFSIVRAKGGYDSVSKRKLWGFAARKLGFRARNSASVKLVYFMYLSELENWLADDENSSSFGGGVDGNSRILSLELVAEFKGLLPKVVSAQLDDVENIGDSRDFKESLENGKDCKRKRECFSETVKWLKEMAKLSSDHSSEKRVGEVSESVEDIDGKELYSQAMRAREALLLRRHVESVSNNDESNSQKKPKMHPSMYEDKNARYSNFSSERLRCSKRVPNVVKSRLCPCCNTLSSIPHKPVIEPPPPPPPPPVEEEELPHLPLPEASDPESPLASGDEPTERQVSVGPQFQAHVPEWTGLGHDSDPKWLGTLVYPLTERADSTHNNTSVVGKGRRRFCCRCPFRGSGECVRFHIAEARLKMKLELGPTFFAWGFHRMGEEVSLGWSLDDEMKFKEVVRSYKSFGDRKVWWFLKKSRESLVSYYFNVFLVQKRSYQNRVTPKDVDSDDDETEFGSIGGHYGNCSVSDDLSSPGFVACIQNRQCADLDEKKCGSEINPLLQC